MYRGTFHLPSETHRPNAFSKMSDSELHEVHAGTTKSNIDKGTRRARELI